MPVYEYECRECGAITEMLRKVAEADTELSCERCGSTHTHRVHSVFAPASREPSTPDLPMGGCTHCGNPDGPCGL